MDTLLNNIMMWSWLVYTVLFLVMAVESAGMPVPGLTLVLAAAALAGQGHLNFWLVLAATVAGGTLGGAAGYWLGRQGGRKLVERFGRYILLNPARLQAGEALFQKHGYKAVLAGRYLPVLCFLAGILSGIARMDYRRFFIYNFASILLWSCSQLTLAFIFGRSVEKLFRLFNNIGLACLIMAALAGAFFFLRYKRRQRLAFSRVKVAINDQNP